MFIARLKSFKSFLILILISIIVISVTSGGVLAQGPGHWPPRMPGYPNGAKMTMSSINPASANELALAMGVSDSDLLVADLMGSDPAGVGVSDSSLGTWFPTEGSTFAILSTGLAVDASLPNNEGNLSTELSGLYNSQGYDLVRLHLQLKVPGDKNCASVDFAFYSEEFPEFVGSAFNDTFTAQLNNSLLTIGQDNLVTAPGNFAFDTQNNIISVNSTFGYSLETGTTYDGVTPLLRASTAVVPGASIDLYFSVQDLGDSIYDSAVFLDKFFWSNDPGCAVGAEVDTDGDGLLDDWETNGLHVTVGGVDKFVNLPAMGADPLHKDIFVEADYMTGHQPIATSIWVIADAFENAPVPNPDGTTGIHLHVDYGPSAPLIWEPGNWGSLSQADELVHQTNLGTCPGPSFDYDWSAFDTIKNSHFATERAAVFHYNVWAHSLCADYGSTSGISRNGSGTAFGSGASDFIVSLGGWTDDVGSAYEHAGTFMHELGHNLGLMHGGGDHTQWKPNYISVMNYAFQTRGLFIGGSGGYFDYSRYDLPDLNENSLSEATGIGAPVAIGTYHFCGLDDMRPDTDASSVDWNCDGDQTDTGLSYNINQGMSWNNNTTLDTLTTQNDWVNLVYSGGAIGAPGAMVLLPSQSEVIDITIEQDAQIPSFPSSDYLLFLPLIVR
jgi:hypothetical protein